MVDMACAIYGFTTVPLYDTLGPENISYVLNHSNVQSVFCSGDSCKTIASTSDIGRLKVIITFDPLSDEVSNLFEERGLKWFDFTDLLEMGGSRPHNIPKTLPENIVTFSYTSGTTGPPKAVMISQANFVSCCAILKTKPDVRFYPTDVYLSYLPLPHVLERTYMYGMLSAGGQIWYIFFHNLAFTPAMSSDLKMISSSSSRQFLRVFRGYTTDSTTQLRGS